MNLKETPYNKHRVNQKQSRSHIQNGWMLISIQLLRWVFNKCVAESWRRLLHGKVPGEQRHLETFFLDRCSWLAAFSYIAWPLMVGPQTFWTPFIFIIFEPSAVSLILIKSSHQQLCTKMLIMYGRISKGANLDKLVVKIQKTLAYNNLQYWNIYASNYYINCCLNYQMSKD